MNKYRGRIVGVSKITVIVDTHLFFNILKGRGWHNGETN